MSCQSLAAKSWLPHARQCGVRFYEPAAAGICNFRILCCYNNINSRLDATMIILLTISISSTCFGREFRPSSGALDCVYSLWYKAPTMLPAGDQDEVEVTSSWSPASSVHYTTNCKHSLVLLRMGEILARNMLS